MHHLLRADPNNGPRPIHQPGPCGQRSSCWRQGCGEQWGELRTVETLDFRAIIAYCHHKSYTGVDDFEWKVNLWRHGAASETSA